jgi:hypothetical protein
MTNDGIARAAQALPQRQRLRGVCAACREIFFKQTEYIYSMFIIDELVKSPKFRHAPAFAGAGSAKAGIQNYLKTLDSRLRGKDVKGCFKTFCETIIIRYSPF